MDTKTAVSNDVSDLADTHLARILDFKGAPGYEAAIVNSEHQCLKEWPVFAVEWTIDKDVLGVVQELAVREKPSRGYCLYERFRLTAFAAERAADRDTVPVFAELFTVRLFAGALWERVLPAADFDAALVRPSRSVLEAAVAAELDVDFLGALV